MRKYIEYKDKMPFPIYAQAKLDGVNCRAIMENGSVKLLTRNDIEIVSCDHLKPLLEIKLQYRTLIEGELYRHHWDFDKISSLVRKQKNFSEETKEIKLFEFRDLAYNYISDEPSLEKFLDSCIERDFEGVVLYRINPLGDSFDVMKHKRFYEEEFTIVNYVYGKGKLSNHIGAFVCETNGKEFRVKMEGSFEKLKELVHIASSLVGEKLTVRFQKKTKNGIPRFPIGKDIRWDI